MAPSFTGSLTKLRFLGKINSSARLTSSVLSSSRKQKYEIPIVCYHSSVGWCIHNFISKGSQTHLREWESSWRKPIFLRVQLLSGRSSSWLGAMQCCVVTFKSGVGASLDLYPPKSLQSCWALAVLVRYNCGTELQVKIWNSTFAGIPKYHSTLIWAWAAVNSLLYSEFKCTRKVLAILSAAVCITFQSDPDDQNTRSSSYIQYLPRPMIANDHRTCRRAMYVVCGWRISWRSDFYDKATNNLQLSLFDATQSKIMSSWY